ncbi:MAG: glycoside hydrolase family 13 protein [Clostridia bacterium]|nr:glycoside hydrolase family 13 protein [Clostridia bacterium]
MDQSAVRHHSFYPFVQPVARDQAIFLLEAARGDLSACTLVWWKRSEPEKVYRESMSVRYGTENTDQWAVSARFPEEAHYIKYHFVLRDQAGAERVFNAYGFDRDLRGCFELLQINSTDVIAVPEWARGCIWYQIFPERFEKDPSSGRAPEPWDAEPTRDNYLGGTLSGIRRRLPYLADLGIECVYLNPIFKADFNHKYATADYLAVDPMFGTEADLIALVDEAHRLGIRIVLDGVFNHAGIHFAPFEDLMQNGSASAYADWFYLKKEPVVIDPACYECVGDYPYMPRLNGACEGVREYVLKVLLYWLEKARIDGWRFDVADELDMNAVRYWRESVKRLYPDAVMLAETWGSAVRMIAPGTFDCAMNYLFRDAAVDFFARGSITPAEFRDRLAAMLQLYPDRNMHAMYNCLGSHDTARFLTEAGEDLRRLELAMAFQMLFPGAPAVYYGDEIGMKGENDPGCRGGMAWQAINEDLLAVQKRWIAFRKAHAAVRKGGIRLLPESDPALFSFSRFSGDEEIIAIFNTDAAPHSTDFADEAGSVDVLPRSVKIIIKHKEEM